MKRFLLLYICACVFSVVVHSQNFSSSFRSINEIRTYLASNVSKLDPIEGEYDVHEIIRTGSPLCPQRSIDYIVVIVRNPNNKNIDQYLYYQGDFHKVTNSRITQVGSSNYYDVTVYNSKGRATLKNNSLLTYKIDFNKEDGRIVIGNRIFEPWVKGEYSLIKQYPSIEMYADAAKKETEIAKPEKWSGSGFFISKEGYVVTNQHVIEDAKSIKITCVNGDKTTQYRAKVEVSDKQNDLAILKITDTFRAFTNIPYTLKFSQSSIGEDCWVLGYPLVSTMGYDIKLTNGVISSKSGFEGNISQYQFSAPVQPGNSGGPLFDKKGNIIGIVQAKHGWADNAGYAVKTSYLKNLMDMLSSPISLPQTNQLANKNLPQQVELASKYVCLVICE